jgi:hypothetical protein
MHWRKPFPPRSVRPTPLAELKALITTALDGEKDALPEKTPPESEVLAPPAIRQ